MKTIIGLEVHVELKTKSKMFCGCKADYFGQTPNTYTCPVCLGLPGALPVPNKIAIDWCIMIGLALDCDIPNFSKFDRKNYFYPDLPKGYQISQYDQPFCVNGKIKLKNGKEIRIRRVHMEEDTGKLIHENLNGETVSLIDFNRSGVPLVEIVTEPDFESAEDVKEYLKKLQQIVRYLEISNADMEKGDMRLEPNISVSTDGSLPKYKVEVKNINSFTFVERAINYEVKRQTELLEKKETPVQETRGWDDKKQKTVSQRIKEEASDYRYFPEPDIPPIRISELDIKKIREQIKELPNEKFERFIKEYKLPEYDAEILTREIETADFFEKAVLDGKKHNVSPKQIANYIINRKPNIEEVLPAQLVQNIIKSSRLTNVNDEKLNEIVEKVLNENTQAVSDYKNGKEPAIMFLLGQVMRKLKSKVDTNIVKKLIKEKIK